MRRLLVLSLMLVAAPAWADPASDLATCQQQTATLTIQARDAQQARTAYVAKLAEMLAEMREQLDQARAQVQQLGQELQRLRLAKPPEPSK